MSDQKTHSILQSIKNKLANINKEPEKKSKFDEIHKEFDSKIATDSHKAVKDAINQIQDHSKNSASENENYELESEDYAFDASPDFQKITEELSDKQDFGSKQTSSGNDYVVNESYQNSQSLNSENHHDQEHEKNDDLPKSGNEIMQRNSNEQQDFDLENQKPQAVLEKENLSKKSPEEIRKIDQNSSDQSSYDLAKPELDKSIPALVEDSNQLAFDPMKIEVKSVINDANSQSKSLSSLEEIERSIGQVPSLINDKKSSEIVDPIEILQQEEFLNKGDDSEKMDDMQEIAKNLLEEANKQDQENHADENSKTSSSLEDAERALFGEEFVAQKYGSKDKAEPKQISVQDSKIEAIAKADEKSQNDPKTNKTKESNSTLEEKTSDSIQEQENAVEESDSKKLINLDSKDIDATQHNQDSQSNNLSQVLENKQKDDVKDSPIEAKNDNPDNEKRFDDTETKINNQKNLEEDRESELSSEIENKIDSEKTEFSENKESAYNDKFINTDIAAPNKDQKSEETFPAMTSLKSEIDEELSKALLDIDFKDKKTAEIRDKIDINSVENQNYSNQEVLDSFDSPVLKHGKNDDLQQSYLNKDENEVKNFASGLFKKDVFDRQNSESEEDLQAKDDIKEAKKYDNYFDEDLSKNSDSEQILAQIPLSKSASSPDIISKLHKSHLLNEETITQTSLSIKKLIDAKNSLGKVSQLLQDKALTDIATTMMEPKLEKWLNENLAELVEKIVKEEIARIVHGNDSHDKK